MAKPVKETKVVEKHEEMAKVETKPDAEYVTLNFKGLSLPWAILLSVIVFTAGIGSALYFGLQSRAPVGVASGTPTPTTETFAANEFSEVSIPFKDGATNGNANAKVVVLEFSDLVCPYCKKFHDESYGAINDNYIKTGKIKFVYKHYPLSFHEPAASIAAKSSYCVEANYGDEKMFAFNDLFFGNSNVVTQNAYDSNNQPVINMKEKQFYALFSQIGVDSNKIKDCVKSADASNRINSDIAELVAFEKDIVSKGLSQGLGTPSFIVGIVKDGVLKGRLIEGAYPSVAFTNVIEEQLAK